MHIMRFIRGFIFGQTRVPPKSECGCLHGGVIENGRIRNPLTLCSVPVLVPVQVWVHILGDPQNVQLRNATTNLSTVVVYVHCLVALPSMVCETVSRGDIAADLNTVILVVTVRSYL